MRAAISSDCILATRSSVIRIAASTSASLAATRRARASRTSKASDSDSIRARAAGGVRLSALIVAPALTLAATSSGELDRLLEIWVGERAYASGVLNPVARW